jgi:lysophospholipase L1-like esterase
VKGISTDMQSNRLLIVGDSITLGAAEVRGNSVVSTVTTCYVDLLRDALPGLDIRVDADVHRSTSDAVSRLNHLLELHRPTVVLFMLGGNDADIDWKRLVLSDGQIVRGRASLEKYQSNLEGLATRTREFGAWPVLVDLPNSDVTSRSQFVARQTNRDVSGLIERLGGQAASDERLAAYQHAARSAAERCGADFVAYGRELERHARHVMVAADGAHPSSDGHRVIAETLLPAIVGAMKPGRVAATA